MAAHILDGYPPPHELAKAMDYRAWGVDLAHLPAGELPTLNAAYNTHQSVSGWKRGGGDWIKANPQGWEFVSAVIADRMQRIKAGTWPD